MGTLLSGTHTENCLRVSFAHQKMLDIFSLRINCSRASVEQIKLEDALNQVGSVFFLRDEISPKYISRSEKLRCSMHQLYHGFYLVIEKKVVHEVCIFSDGMCQICGTEAIEFFNLKSSHILESCVVLLRSVLPEDKQKVFLPSVQTILQFLSQIEDEEE